MLMNIQQDLKSCAQKKYLENSKKDQNVKKQLWLEYKKNDSIDGS